ncbi:class I SAM-dependent methyltransferase [Puia dinghuensis]|uniref:Class I SAM-dependent methyltransferase n=1 Tax=Puia dinghuensis TaxID=1792502 RepID=A0A8J2XW28_9BACT|nr:class I SAM-dependent methyltransferase [Puia dinghuensis]GGB22958.1 hypothetical protein GCM10011511_53600 [Puia dinghuensis]
MTHREAISLIDNAWLRNLTAYPPSTGPGNLPQAPQPGPTRWADLGCGSGTFTLALAHFLPKDSAIEAIDLHPDIKRQTTSNGVHIHPREADFVTGHLHLQHLDGILMANALHFVRDKPALLQTLHSALRPGGIFLLVEYDSDTPVPLWVPYPLSFTAAPRLFSPPRWTPIQKGNTRPSTFGRGQLYSALTHASL